MTVAKTKANEDRFQNVAVGRDEDQRDSPGRCIQSVLNFFENFLHVKFA